MAHHHAFAYFGVFLTTTDNITSQVNSKLYLIVSSRPYIKLFDCKCLLAS